MPMLSTAQATKKLRFICKAAARSVLKQKGMVKLYEIVI